MHREVEHHDFVIRWQEPPLTAPFFQVSIAGVSEEARTLLATKTFSKSAFIIKGNDREDALSKAEKLIDNLLAGNAAAVSR